MTTLPDPVLQLGEEQAEQVFGHILDLSLIHI